MAEAEVHVDAGYIILGLLLYRLVRGLIGGKYERFSDFVYGPVAMARYLQGILAGRPQRYIGHNPAGGLMVVLLLVTLFVATWSGMEVYAEEGRGPLAATNSILVHRAYADDDESEKDSADSDEEYWEELHELTSNLAMLLVVIHIAGVFVSGKIHHENLVKSMITGKKKISE